MSTPRPKYIVSFLSCISFFTFRRSTICSIVQPTLNVPWSVVSSIGTNTTVFPTKDRSVGIFTDEFG
ncbi:hypothetical protein AX774_g3537 [Zancudomyces culisetae]|uniref:Uncharacterized protein n=1 Tax=Zancudomyces culisetae TaxID=1213189 RepID=A0A1R1PPP9_ZANCU|nr:hypothetical protein AX774_g3537 [Zancudomyces culisetae]|eukprot:OMH82966.1 hypothetical protein AX774_g3537 [Zancudomyces culisetae]